MARVLAENPKISYRSKNIDVRIHFLRGLVRLGQITITTGERWEDP